MHRVRDIKKDKWIEDIYLSNNGELYELQLCFIFVKRKVLLNKDDYILHKYIELNDKNNTPIFEGDYVEAKISDNVKVIGVVIYAEQLSSYVILCDDTSEYYDLGKGLCDRIEVIGNVFDGYTV